MRWCEQILHSLEARSALGRFFHSAVDLGGAETQVALDARANRARADDPLQIQLEMRSIQSRPPEA